MERGRAADCAVHCRSRNHGHADHLRAHEG